jgi:protein SCO1/2
MRRGLALTLAAWVVLGSVAAAQPSVYSPEATFSYDQRLGTPIPPELVFQDEQGRDVRLGDFLGKHPVILVLAQYRCPMLCNQVLNGLVDCLRGLPASAGADFEVVVVSFDPREKPELAAAKKATYAADYGRPGAEAGWHFLTGPQGSIDTLTLAVGFQYAYSQQQDRFAHPSGVVILTPEGKVSAYLYGILYPAEEMRSGLDKAAAGKIGAQVPTYRRVLLLCYDYDASTGGYSANVMKMVRAGGVLIVLVLGVSLSVAWVRERRAAARRAVAATAAGGPP